jgi:peptide deformylase
MVETLDDIGGIGLAAPQIHVSKRVVIFFIPDHRAEDDADVGDEEGPQPLTIMINPTIEPLTEEKDIDWEACLSVPDLLGAVPRYTRIRYRWSDLDGQQHERTAAGFHARAVQHEYDHLDGILYPQRMTDVTLLGFAEEMRRFSLSSEEAEDFEE